MACEGAFELVVERAGEDVIGDPIGERRDVEEYCVSEGWVRVAAGKALDRRGQPLTIKLKGEVEAWFKLPDAE